MTPNSDTDFRWYAAFDLTEAGFLFLETTISKLLSLLLLAFWKNLIILLRHRDYNKTSHPICLLLKSLCLCILTLFKYIFL